MSCHHHSGGEPSLFPSAVLYPSLIHLLAQIRGACVSGRFGTGSGVSVVLVPGPSDRIRGDRRVESPLAQLQLGVVDTVAALDEPERQSTGTDPLGVGVATLGLDALVALEPGNIPQLQSVGINRTVLLFTLGLAVATAMIGGLLPAFRLPMDNLTATLREGGHRAGGGAGQGDLDAHED